MEQLTGKAKLRTSTGEQAHVNNMSQHACTINAKGVAVLQRQPCVVIYGSTKGSPHTFTGKVNVLVHTVILKAKDTCLTYLRNLVRAFTFRA
jgi:hypothetical protein